MKTTKQLQERFGKDFKVLPKKDREAIMALPQEERAAARKARREELKLN